MEEMLDEIYPIVKKLIKLFFLIGLFVIVFITAGRWVDNSLEAVEDNTNVKTTIARYEKLNDAYNECVRRHAKFKLNESELDSLKKYEAPIKECSKIREQIIIQKDSYNELASKYNSAMNKMNYAGSSKIAEKYNKLPKQLKIFK